MAQTSLPNEDRTDPPGRAFKVLALAGGGFIVFLAAVYLSLLVFGVRQVAPEAGSAPIAENLSAMPAWADVDEMVRLTASNLSPGADVAILAGLDRENLRPIGSETANEAGAIDANVKIPEWARRGEPFWLATEENGARKGVASVNIRTRGASSNAANP